MMSLILDEWNPVSLHPVYEYKGPDCMSEHTSIIVDDETRS